MASSRGPGVAQDAIAFAAARRGPEGLRTRPRRAYGGPAATESALADERRPDRAGRDAEQRLRELLQELHGHRGNPRDYFAGPEGVVRFSDVSEAVGLAGVSSGRLAWGDYDGDGFQDLLLDGPRLFRNDGRGGFQDVTRNVGLDGFSGSNGGVWGDYDNDGYLDLLMTARRGNRLLHNEGGIGFGDVTSAAGIGGVPQRTEAAAWGDMDNDGWLDLYLANYERPSPIRALCHPDRLLRNRRDGRFEDVTGPADHLELLPTTT